VHPDDRDRCLTANAQALERREPFAVEFRLQRHDGEYRFVLDHGAPRIAADGSLAGFAGTCLDIHDRAVAEQRVRRLSMLYAALSHANEAIARTRDRAAMLRRICEIVVADGGFCTAWIGMVDSGQRGVRTAAYAGMAFEFFDRIALPLDAAHAIVAPPVRVIRDGRPYISNDRDADTSVIRLPAGAGTFVRSSAVVPIVQSGAVVGALAVHAGEVNYFDDELTKLLLLLAEDLSFALERISAEDRREHAEIALRQVNATLEERIAERTRSLEQANRELEAFSYSVSHDLRAPLRAIAGFTDLAIESAAGRLDEESRRYLDRVRAASRRMSTLINDLLDLSRIARSELTRGAVDLSSLAEEIVGELRSEDPARTVHVTIEPGVVANADRGLVRILLANLLGNAWKFTSRRPDATIEFGAVSEHGIRRFFVRDNGAGFDMAHAHKLFTPFQRLHSEREFSGTGIGLAIVRRIAERHGGDAVARSSEGAGTTIVFTLERASSHGD
jgi:signal transduction histidine kinase